MEKPTFVTAASPLYPQAHGAAFTTSWTPGKLSRLPWKGLGAAILALFGIAGCIGILLASHNAPITSWKFQPAVYLAIATTIINVVLHYSLTEGANVFWWRRALEQDSTLGELHRHWDQGNSLWAALTNGRHFTLLSLAAILVAIAPINGPLVQRASIISSMSVVSNTAITIDTSPDLLPGYSGFLSGRGYTPALLSSDFQNVFKRFINDSDIAVTPTGCRGICSGAKISGVGFSVECSSNVAPYDLNFVTNVNEEPMEYGTQAFMSGFYWSSFYPAQLTIGVQYKNDAACSGNLQIQNCTLNLTNVNYPVVVDGQKNTITLDPSTSIFDDEPNYSLGVPDLIPPFPGPTTLGGVWLALSSQFNSVANLRFVGAVGYELIATGAMASYHVVPSSIQDAENCTITWTDPLEDLLAAARDLMFRVSIAAANGTNIQTVQASDTVVEPVYSVNYAYLAGGCALTLLAFLAVLPTFHKYWMLGRNVSMSPLEIGKALGAPILESVNSNAKADEMVHEVGHVSARYGMVHSGRLMIAPREYVSPLRHDMRVN